MNRIFEWLWSFLPDKCRVPGCARRNVRGNENVIDGVIVCDDCHAAMGARQQRDVSAPDQPRTGGS